MSVFTHFGRNLGAKRSTPAVKKEEEEKKKVGEGEGDVGLTLSVNGGVRLVGLDQPEEVSGDRLRVYASVRMEDSSQAPSHVALMLRIIGKDGALKTSKATKLLTGSEDMPIGIEVPVEEGTHTLQAFICAATQSEVGQVLFECCPKALTCTAPPPSPATEATGCGLPRIMQSRSVVLCGIDVPSSVELGKRMRVMVALKRIWEDAPSHLSLIVRATTPSGMKLAAVSHSRTLGDDAEAFGLHVPVSEAGDWAISCQVAVRDEVTGELEELFAIPSRSVHVPHPPALAEAGGIQVVAIDMPEEVRDGTMRCIVSLRRTASSSPSSLAFIVRNKTTGQAARVLRTADSLCDFAVGLSVPLTMLGEHEIQAVVAQVCDDGSIEELIALPPRTATVPKRKIAHDEQHSLVLCRCTVNGRLWPAGESFENSPNGGDVVLGFSFARTWDDAPTRIQIEVSGKTPQGSPFSLVSSDPLSSSTHDLLHYDLSLSPFSSLSITFKDPSTGVELFPCSANDRNLRAVLNLRPITSVRDLSPNRFKLSHVAHHSQVSSPILLRDEAWLYVGRSKPVCCDHPTLAKGMLGCDGDDSDKDSTSDVPDLIDASDDDDDDDYDGSGEFGRRLSAWGSEDEEEVEVVHVSFKAVVEGGDTLCKVIRRFSADSRVSYMGLMAALRCAFKGELESVPTLIDDGCVSFVDATGESRPLRRDADVRLAVGDAKSVVRVIISSATALNLEHSTLSPITYHLSP